MNMFEKRVGKSTERAHQYVCASTLEILIR